MHNEPLYFVIPTYRLKDVGETVRMYDDNFRRNGHDVTIIVSDDSSLGAHQKYFPDFAKLKTHSPLMYVGPMEKEKLIASIASRLRDKALESVVRQLFRPSYGGNRNVLLAYTLGSIFVSADDDMRPWGLIEDSPESLKDGEIAHGKLVRANGQGYSRREYDILAAYLDVLGKPVSEAPTSFALGDHLADTATDLQTNASTGPSRENSLLLKGAPPDPTDKIVVAQTFRSGTNDIDALDYVDLFLDDPAQDDIDALNDVYTLVNFRPCVTQRNWRIDCGVSGYDNRTGLPPFFPTRLRFEDYIYRLWIQQAGLAAAHVDAVQTHLKSNYMRSPLASEVFNEEICNLLKRKFNESGWSSDELTVTFEYDGHVSMPECESMLGRVRKVADRAKEEAAKTTSAERRQALEVFGVSLERAFYGFETDFFQQNVARIVDDVVSQIKASIELWPRLVEICYFQKHRTGLPTTLIGK